MSTNIVHEFRCQPPGCDQSSLEVFLAPERVAIVGATDAPDSAGGALMANLIRYQCGATLFPINPSRKAVFGIRAHPSISAVPLPIDLAIVATPAATVPGIIRDCRTAGVRGAIIISADFGEGSGGGTELEQQIAAELQHGDLRVLGPNCLGVACPRTGLNATFAPTMVRRGGVGLLSQSGALLTALLSPELPEHVGCSAFISLGSMAGIGWAEWLAYLGDDPQTEVIGMYAETLGDMQSFIRAASTVASRKPVVLVKSGRLTEQDEVYEEPLRRAGVLRVQTISDLIRMAEILASQPPARGHRLMIVSNARGPALLAADALHAHGGDLAVPADATVRELEALMPGRNHHRNIIDLGDDISSERFAQAAAIAARDPNSDAVLLLLTPHATIDARKTAELVSRWTAERSKPILASWMWGAATPASVRALHEAHIATFASPELAVRALSYLWQHNENLQGERRGVSPPAY